MASASAPSSSGARPGTSRHWTGIEAGRLDGEQLFAFFEPNNYEEVGFEVGLRYYLATQSRLKSYVAPIVGVRFLNEILVSYSVPEAGSSIRFIPFTKEGAVPVFGLDIGFTLRPRQPLLRRHGHGHPLPVGARRVRLPARPGRPRRQRRPLVRPGDGRAGHAVLTPSGAKAGGLGGGLGAPQVVADPLAPSLVIQHGEAARRKRAYGLFLAFLF